MLTTVNIQNWADHPILQLVDVTHNTFELNDLSWGKKDFVDDHLDIYFTKIQFAFFLLLANNCYIDWEN